MSLFRPASDPLSVTALREMLSCGWSQHGLSEATGDEVDDNGWITLEQTSLGNLSLRMNHPSFPDGLVWEDDCEGGSNIWTFLLKRNRLGRPTVEVF